MKRCHCSKMVPRGHGYKPAQEYCSYKCYQDKPPKVLYLERIYEKPIEEVLKDVQKMNNSHETKAALLGVTRQTYYRYIKKYLAS